MTGVQTCALPISNLPVQTAEVEFVLKTRNYAHCEQIVAKLGEVGFKARVQRNDE